jgi:hypothetical protein
MKKGFLFSIVAALIATVMFTAPVFAAGDKGDDAWHFDLAPFYLWAASVEGDFGVGPISSSLDASFGDIVDNLDMVFTAHFEARKGAYGLIFNLDYLNLGHEATLPVGPKLKIDFKNTMVEFDGFYRIRKDAHNFDLLAGLRYTKQDTSITLKPGPSAGADESWWDPIIGARWQFGFADGWSLSTRGDIGGFGVGTDFTWQLTGIVQWQPWKNVALLAGYRALNQDYEEGCCVDRYKWDGILHGPVLGVNFRW